MMKGRGALGRTLWLGASTAVITTVLATSAWAQSAPLEAAVGAEASGAQAVPAVPDDAQAGDVQSDSPIVVTGRRAALEAATDRKRKSETMIDSIVADDAGKLPDNSITEVLQRLPGVAVVRFSSLGDTDHFSVEGSGIQIRGLTGVQSRLNGREIFSANGGRALQFGDVTPELMAAVDAYKASTADLIEGGTGGQVDLRTKLPFDFSKGLHVAATADLSVGDLARKADASGSILLTNRWETPIGEIGLLADFAYSRLSSTSHFFRMQAYFPKIIDGKRYQIPGGYNYGEEQFQRTRKGIYGAFQWAPDDTLTLNAIYFQSRYNNNSGDWGAFVNSSSMVVDPAVSKFDADGALLSTPAMFLRDNNTFLPSGNPIATSGNKGVYRNRSKTEDISFSFDWNPGKGPLAVRGALQRVDSSYVFDRFDIFRDITFPESSFGIDLTKGIPVVTRPANSSAAFANPANYFWAATMPHNENNRGRLESANLDLEYTFEDSFFRSVKVGGRIARRTERDLNNGFNWAALGRGWNGDPQLTFANARPGDTELHVFKNFFHGDTVIPANTMYPTESLGIQGILDRALVHRPPPTGFCGTSADALFNNCSPSGVIPQLRYGGLAGIRQPGFVLPIDRSDNRTETKAAYALVRFGDTSLGFAGNVGARFISVRNTASGFFQQSAVTYIRNGQTINQPNIGHFRSGTAQHDRLLPSVNLQYNLSEQFKARASWNITMDNQSFGALRATGTLGVATQANPANTPTNQLPPIFQNYTTDSGNPFMKPTMANNFDVAFEYYGRGKNLHLSAFYKRLTDQPVYTSVQQPVAVDLGNGTIENTTAVATNVLNSPDAATVKGIEVGGRMFFDMLPGWLAGFGIEGNYTFVDSKNPGDRYRDINGVIRNDAPLVGLSRHNFNVMLLYERNPISFRVAYSWRSEYLQSTNASGTNPTYDFYTAPGVFTNIVTSLPTYGDAYGQLEAGIRFKVTENFQFGIQGTNLLNSMQRTLMGGYANDRKFVRSWFQSDRRISVGANLAF